MVEFKHQQSPDRLVLMEINPKFWGSVELALEAGVDFASDLVRVPRPAAGLQRMLRPPIAFLLAPGRRHRPPCPAWQPGKVREYFAPHARTNVGYSHTADALKALRTCCRLVHA